MGRYAVRIVQTFRVEREIVVTIDADNPGEAVDRQCESDALSFDAPGWSSTWSLENEEVSLG